MKSLQIVTLAAAATSAWVIYEIFAYIHSSNSNHTSFEPWLLVIVFIPTVVFGVVAIGRRFVAAGLLAMLIGASGLAVLTYIDRTNTMVQYDRWLSRGMPRPHQPSRHVDVR
jgi:hypothetical protein